MEKEYVLPRPDNKRYHFDKNFITHPKTYGGISLIQIGRMHCTPQTVIPTHFHLNWFELTIVTDGCGIVTANGDSVSMKRGDIHLSLPGDFHAIASDSAQPLKYDFFSFYTDDAFLGNELEEIIRNLPGRVFREERIPWLVGNAIAEIGAPGDMTDLLLEPIFRQIVLYLIRAFRNVRAEGTSPRIGQPEELCYQMMNYIDTHIYAMESLSELADALNYSYSYLSDLFHRVTGDTLHGYYRNRRLAAAQLLIREGKQKIGEIADLLHYSSIYTFSRAFRDAYGMSPSEYKRSAER
ncbi:MAG: helix-turn-helix domain-containing protein [Clostridia bacterium]|nr:helix-turn-helix domain-containing protein [Clostridia bacterium]